MFNQHHLCFLLLLVCCISFVVGSENYLTGEVEFKNPVRVDDKFEMQSTRLGRGYLRQLITYIGTLVLILASNAGSGQEYSYKNPKMWKSDYPDCGGEMQSPVNINFRKLQTVQCPGSMSALSLDGYSRLQPHGQILISGTAMQIPIQVTPEQGPLTISGALLDTAYFLIGLYLRWGLDEWSGTEHAYNGDKNAMEIQFVHSSTESDSLVVLAVLVDLDEKKNNKKAMEMLSVIAERALSDDGDPFLVLDDLVPRKRVPVFRYQGSLTTPPCSETILQSTNNDLFPGQGEPIDRGRY